MFDVDQLTCHSSAYIYIYDMHLNTTVYALSVFLYLLLPDRLPVALPTVSEKGVKIP